MARTEEGARVAIEGIDGLLTEEQVRALDEREHALFGGGDVKSHLPELNAAMEHEQYRRLLPGYVRRFVETAPPLIDLRIEGDPNDVFELAQSANPRSRPRARRDGVLPGRDARSADVLSTRRQKPRHLDASGRASLRSISARRCSPVVGARHAGERSSWTRMRSPLISSTSPRSRSSAVNLRRKLPVCLQIAQGAKSALLPKPPRIGSIGLRQESDGAIALCPLEHLLLLGGAENVAPGSVPLARLARGPTELAEEWLRGEALARIVDEHRGRAESGLPERQDWIARGFDYKSAELIAKRQRVGAGARQGDSRRDDGTRQGQGSAAFARR